MDKLSDVDMSKILNQCLRAMKQFPTSEDILRYGFFCVERSIDVLGKKEMLQESVLSTLASCILENDKLTTVEAIDLKKNVAKFIGSFVKKISFAK